MIGTPVDHQFERRNLIRHGSTLSHWERVGVRDYKLSMGRHPSPGASRHPLPLGEGKCEFLPHPIGPQP
jgi:hypothetical protein